MRVFMNYRRSDTVAFVRGLHRELEHALGHGQVLVDIESIPLGAAVDRYIRWQLTQCSVVLAIVGRTWMPERLREAGDFVRLELELALDSGLHVLPVLVDGARMPQATSLPARIRGLADRNGIELNTGSRDYGKQVQALVTHIREVERLRRRRSTLHQGVIAAMGPLGILVQRFL